MLKQIQVITKKSYREETPTWLETQKKLSSQPLAPR